ncbi:sulfur oxidation c-type cytochrome SoxX [Halovulum dunhuangense]|uniref:Sulfur oxidation c-type cytochrome SoxX n=1 Tax=Halovulum dunhuangense TaxID=1505036 RepID=A0A849KQV8_9RHOB|nr:sulfur oxidation c-type cytochrome SoxX [Halovulum dunhuangense]NNU79249.1 sulfur oxidation c-type cytochrome SoxX [Halovulum dunhuangense]
MKIWLSAAIALAGVSVAAAEVIEPTDVRFENGAIMESLTGVPGDPAEGRKVMNRGAGNCIACHEVSALSDLPFHGEVGPLLDGVGSRWTEAELRGLVANPKMMFEGTIMPAFYKTEGFIRPGEGYTAKAPEGPLKPILSAQQIEDVVAFLMTLTD